MQKLFFKYCIHPDKYKVQTISKKGQSPKLIINRRIKIHWKSEQNQV